MTNLKFTVDSPVLGMHLNPGIDERGVQYIHIYIGGLGENF